MSRRVRYEPGWHALDDLERSLKKLSRDASVLGRKAEKQLAEARDHAGTKAFAALTCSALAARSMVVGLEAQVVAVADYIAASKTFLDRAAAVPEGDVSHNATKAGDE